MKKVFVDLDNTLNDLIFKWIEYCNNIFKKDFTIHHIDKWTGIYELYPCQETVFNFFKAGIYEKDFVLPLPESKEFLKSLKESGREIIIITDTFDFHLEEKPKWIEKHFGDVIDGIILSNHDKHNYIEKEDIFIDDNPKHIKNSKSKHNFLFNYKNNYKHCFEIPLEDKEHRVVTDYEEIKKIIL